MPLNAHGTFYEGDCYIILSVSTMPPIPMSCSPESQLWGPTGRSAREVNLVSILILPRFYIEQASSLTIKGFLRPGF